MASIQQMVDAIHNYFTGKATAFVVNQDVNASAFGSGETEVDGAEDAAYRLSGSGAFTLTVDFTDGNGTTVASFTDSSTDGTEISGTAPVVTEHVDVSVTDDSGLANTVTGGVKAR